MNSFFRMLRERSSRLWAWSLAHKKLAMAGALIVVLAAGGTIYALAHGGTKTTYGLGIAEKGTVVVSISGTGQVSASNQVTLSSKASGELVAVNAAAGQSVRAGTTIAQVDATDAALELENAKLSYEKLTTVDAPSSEQDANQSLSDAYQSARSSLSSASTDLRTVMDGLDALFSRDGYLTSQRYDLGDTAKTYRTEAERRYDAAKTALDAFDKSYSSITDASTDADIDATLSGSATTAAQAVAAAAKAAKDAVTYMRPREDTSKYQTAADSAFSSVNTLASSANGTVSALASAGNAIRNARQQVTAATGAATEIDIRTSALALRQKQEAYDNYFITAPFDGILASLTAHRGDTVNSGTSIGTFITKQKLAEISLNEVDAAKVKIGQKATLTFDAIDGLSISGTVAEVDYLGTVSQGVVNYTVKVAFDTDDDRIKPGMTVTADIVTDIAQDVLTVPVAALKTNGDATYVQVLDAAPSGAPASNVASKGTPRQVEVTVGLESDELAEITSGLTEGQEVITKTTSSAAKAATPARTTGGFGAAGGGATFRATGAFGGPPR